MIFMADTENNPEADFSEGSPLPEEWRHAVAYSYLPDQEHRARLEIACAGWAQGMSSEIFCQHCGLDLFLLGIGASIAQDWRQNDLFHFAGSLGTLCFSAALI